MNKNGFLIFAVLAILSTTNFAVAGSETRNGSDVVVCQSQEPASLDYVLESSTKELPIANLDLDKSLQRIGNLISQKVPRLTNSFREYVSDLNNSKNFTKQYTWVSQADPLPALLDEKIKKFPAWCNFISDSPSIQQAVIRVTHINRWGGPNRVTFLYNEDLLNRLSPLQKSFVFVHEWLWGHTDDVRTIRKLNYFFHSTLFDKMSPADVTFYLRKNGIKFTDSAPNSQD